MKRGVVGVQTEIAVLQLDYQLDRAIFFPRRKIHQRVLVTRQLRPHFGEGRLLRGTLVSGASRFRWTGWEAPPESIRSLLASFPDADSSRPFDAAQCKRLVLRGPRQPIGIPRDIGMTRGTWARMLRRRTFWDLLMEIAAAGKPQYRGYSYRDRADVYQLALGGADMQRIREGARLVPFTALQSQIRTVPVEAAELYVVRAAAATTMKLAE